MQNNPLKLSSDESDSAVSEAKKRLPTATRDHLTAFCSLHSKRLVEPFGLKPSTSERIVDVLESTHGDEALTTILSKQLSPSAGLKNFLTSCGIGVVDGPSFFH